MSVSVPAAGVFRPGLLAAAFAGLMLVLYADPLFVRRSFAARDLSAYNLPMEKSVHDAWARGQLPVWTPEVSGGRPLLPNPNAGALYPMRILSRAVAFPLAFRIYPVVHWIAAGIGMILLCRTIGRSAAAAWVGRRFLRGLRRGSRRGVLSAHPARDDAPALDPLGRRAPPRPRGCRDSRCWRCSSRSCSWPPTSSRSPSRSSARRAGSRSRRTHASSFARPLEWPPRSASPRSPPAPQIVATLLWIPQTNRAVIGMKLSDVFLYSIHPWRLLELVIPYPFGPGWHLSMSDMWAFSLFHHRPMGLFATLYQGAFAAIACAVAWRSRERGARFSRILLVGALAIAMLPSLLPDELAVADLAPAPAQPGEVRRAPSCSRWRCLSAIAFDSWRTARAAWAG